MERAAFLIFLGMVLMAMILPCALPDAFRRVRGRVYSAAKGLQHARTLRSVKEWRSEKSGLTSLYYTDPDGDIAAMVAAYADEAYTSISWRLGHDSPGELTVIIYPSFESLRQSVPGDPGNSVGVCWAGVVGVVSPKAWGEIFGPGDQLQLFDRNNPLYHEITHYVLDEMASGNYPRWFSEGLAQIEEFDATGYVWEEPESGLAGPDGDISLGALERAFDREDTLNAAYLKSMWVTGRIMERLGEPGFARLMTLLRRGSGFEAALRALTRLDYDGLELEWRERNGCAGSQGGRIVAGTRGKNPAEG